MAAASDVGGVLLLDDPRWTLVAHLSGNHAWDASAAIAIGVLLIATGFELGRDTKGLLIGEAAAADERRALRAAIESHDDVRELVELLTIHVGRKRSSSAHASTWTRTSTRRDSSVRLKSCAAGFASRCPPRPMSFSTRRRA